jgi:hypothetical protein
MEKPLGTPSTQQRQPMTAAPYRRPHLNLAQATMHLFWRTTGDRYLMRQGWWDFVAKRSRQRDVMKVIYSLKNIPVETSEPIHADNVADQIAEYRRDKLSGTNSIKYWIQYAACFPDLSSYALCILSISASEVAFANVTLALCSFDKEEKMDRY